MHLPISRALRDRAFGEGGCGWWWWEGGGSKTLEQPPGSQPASQPASKRPTQPATEPATQPPRQPASQPPASHSSFGVWFWGLQCLAFRWRRSVLCFRCSAVDDRLWVFGIRVSAFSLLDFDVRKYLLGVRLWVSAFGSRCSAFDFRH